MGPGITAPRTQIPHRTIFLQRGEKYLAQGRSIAGQASRDPGSPDPGVLRNGLLMGKITTVVNGLGVVGYFAPSVYGVTTNAEAAGSVAVEMSAAVAAEIVRRRGGTGTFKIAGPPTANGASVVETVTYSAINTSTGVATVTAIANAFVAGSLIMPTDGSEDMLTFIDDLSYGGVQVVDETNNSVVSLPFPRVPIEGVVHSANILPVWPSDLGVQQYIMSKLNGTGGNQYTFDHRM